MNRDRPFGARPREASVAQQGWLARLSSPRHLEPGIHANEARPNPAPAPNVAAFRATKRGLSPQHRPGGQGGPTPGDPRDRDPAPGSVLALGAGVTAGVTALAVVVGVPLFVSVGLGLAVGAAAEGWARGRERR